MADTVTWKGPERIFWGCALMELLGETTLEHLPLLMSGTRAVETSFQAEGRAAAIRHARRLIGSVLTRRAVQKAIRDFHAHARATGTDSSFILDATTLAFRRAPGQNARIEAAILFLTSPRERPKSRKRLAPLGDLVAQLHVDTKPISVPIRLIDVNVPPPDKHDLNRAPDRNLVVTIAGLRLTAVRLDRLDRQKGLETQGAWKPEGWTDRLENVICIQKRTFRGLEETNAIDLRGLKHLIGLPGAGKTTLISLLCAHLAEFGKRVAVFFTSIETAREYLERLQRYEVRAALLVGRSAATHRSHGDRLSELIAIQGQNGFGETRAGADLFAQTCPLPAFAVNEPDAWRDWRPTDAPCESLYTPGKDTAYLCPLWSRCGRVKNQRELVHASVWLGHIRSADTPVPAHTSDYRLQYFELIAETFDLVIFDEADETQNVLDSYGALTLKLGGTPDSIHIEAQKVTGLAMSGSLPFPARQQLYPHHYAANTFERHLIRFHEEIDRFEREERDGLGVELENRLLTTNFLIRQAIRMAKCPFSSTRRSAVYAFWDSAMYTAFFRDKRPRLRADQLTDALDTTEKDARNVWDALVDAFENYLHALTRNNDSSEELDAITEHFARLIAIEKKSELAPLSRVLVTVGFTIAAYQDLARLTRPLAQQGILPDTAVSNDASDALQNTVPRGLLGTFSSVRYRAHESGSGYIIDYLVLVSTPRLLLHRMHEYGANVLLTSATSWMPDSTAYHVGVEPAYVLQPKRLSNTQLTLRFAPIKHPTREEHLRFSGAGRAQLENLRHMVAHLVKPTVGGSSALERAASAMRTAHGRPRKCALIVNSYDQVEAVVRQIARVNPLLAERTRGVVKRRPEAPGTVEHYILRGQVEALGYEDDVLVVVFPLTALGRGVNIVFSTNDEDNGSAAIGSVYFLIRPHPIAGDLTLMLSTVARETERFDRQLFTSRSLAEVSSTYLTRRRTLYERVMRLLSRPLSASMLPDSDIRPFSANLLIPILQMIGRAIRRSSPAEVYFVDAAWAPLSAEGKADFERSSVLVTMRNLLRDYMTHPDPVEQAVLSALYKPFAIAFDEIEGLNTGDLPSVSDDDDDTFPPTALEDLGDLDLE